MNASRRFRVTYRVTLPPHTKSDRLRVWIPRPFSSEYQVVEESEVESPFPLEAAKDEVFLNEGYYLEPPPSKQPQTVAFHYRVVRRERTSLPLAEIEDLEFDANQLQRPDLAALLGPNINIPIDGFIGYQARSITSPADRPAVKARTVFESLIETLEYDWAGCTPDRIADLGNLEKACDLRTGTCTEWHGLYVGYLRALSVPAQFCFGFNVPASAASGDIKGYHCWSEVFLPKAQWIPVDVSEAWKHPSKRDYYFGNLDCNRVEFHIGRDLKLTPRHDAPSIDKWIFGHAERAGKPFHLEQLEFSYQDC